MCLLTPPDECIQYSGGGPAESVSVMYVYDWCTPLAVLPRTASLYILKKSGPNISAKMLFRATEHTQLLYTKLHYISLDMIHRVRNQKCRRILHTTSTRIVLCSVCTLTPSRGLRLSTPHMNPSMHEDDKTTPSCRWEESCRAHKYMY